MCARAVPFVRFLVALVAGVAVALAGGVAEACTCARSQGPCDGAWDADAVFVGTVTGILDLDTDETPPLSLVSRNVSLTPTETFRGISEATIDVLTGRGGGDCGYPFVVGRTYLVYAYRMPEGRMQTGNVFEDRGRPGRVRRSRVPPITDDRSRGDDETARGRRSHGEGTRGAVSKSAEVRHSSACGRRVGNVRGRIGK